MGSLEFLSYSKLVKVSLITKRGNNVASLENVTVEARYRCDVQSMDRVQVMVYIVSHHPELYASPQFQDRTQVRRPVCTGRSCHRLHQRHRHHHLHQVRDQ